MKITGSVLRFLWFFVSSYPAAGDDHSFTLSGRELRVIIAHFPPTTSILRDSSGEIIGYSGMLYEHLLWVSNYLNFTFTIQPAIENSSGVKLNNGSWSGLIGQILRDECDLVCAPFAITQQRYEAIEFGSYVGGDGAGMLVKYPSTRLSFFGLTMAFSLNVWIGFFVSFIAIVVGFYFIIHLKRKCFGLRYRRFINLSDVVMNILGALTGQGFCGRSEILSVGVLVAVWTLSALVFVNTYSSCLTSYMSLTYRRPDVNSFQDLANQQKLKVAILKGSVAEIDIFKAEQGALKTIGDQLRRCDQNCRLTDFGSLTDMVLRGESVAILPITVCRSAMLQTMLANKGQCRLTTAKETMAYQHMYLGLPKKSPYVAELNRASFWWFAFGIQAYTRRRQIYRTERCVLNYDYRGVSVEMPKLVSLKLEQFYFAFTVLFIGYLITLCQFIYELMTNPKRSA